MVAGGTGGKRRGYAARESRGAGAGLRVALFGLLAAVATAVVVAAVHRPPAFAATPLVRAGIMPTSVAPGAAPALRPAGPQVAAVASEPRTAVRTITVARGGTLEGALRGAGASRNETAEAIRAIERLFDPRRLMPGQAIEIRFTADAGAARLWSVRLPLSATRGIAAAANGAGGYVARRYDPSAPAAEAAASGPLLWVGGAVQTRTAIVRRGQTLMRVAVALGAGRVEADRAIAALSRLFNPRRLQIGQEVTATYGPDLDLLGLAVAVDGDLEIAAYRSEGGAFQAVRTTGADRERFAAEAARGQPSAPEAAGPPPALVALEFATSTHTVRRGDTLIEVAAHLGAGNDEALAATRVLSVLFNVRRLRIGQEISVTFGRRDGDEETRLLSLSIAVDDGLEVTALLEDGGGFEALRTTAAQRQHLIAAAAADPAAEPGAAPAPAIELAVAEEYQPQPPRVAGFDHSTASMIIRRGDTLMEVAMGLGSGAREAFDAAEALADIFNPRRLRVGQIVTATFGRLEAAGDPRLLALAVAVDADVEVAAFLSEAGTYTPRRVSKEEHDQLIAALDREVGGLAAPSAPPPTFDWVATIDRTVTVRPGDTLMEAALSAGATPNDAHEAIQALTAIFDPRRLRAGQELRITFANDATSDWNARLLAINVALDVDREVAALRAPAGDFSPHEIWKPLERRTVRASGTIDDSLFLAAERAGLPMNTIMELIRIYSWDVDFQRDIQAGDAFEVYFERLHDESGAPVKEGSILYASMTLSGTEIRLYRHETPDGIIDYYNEEGHSVRKALLRTPVDGARLSSGYGMRRHPILGYSRMHQGIDFAAPTGTPIRAAGDGVVDFAARNSGYGNYVRIRHNSEYRTAYAHLSRFASGIRPGARVRQGQTIGYVGSTGLATGPHLHYEVLVSNAQVNPMNLKLPAGKRLESVELARFGAARQRIDAGRAGAPDLLVAQADE